MRARSLTSTASSSGTASRSATRSSVTPGVEGPTVLLLPTWTIIHARFWKLQVPYLARHYRVVVYDGPGNGRSDRTTDPARYTFDAYAADAAAVLDECGVERAVVVGVSLGVPLRAAARRHPAGSGAGLVLVGGALPLAELPRARVRAIRPLPRPGARSHRPAGIGTTSPTGTPTTPSSPTWFFEQVLSEPHSTKPHRGRRRVGAESGPRGPRRRGERKPPSAVEGASLLDGVTCPLLFVHGTDDRVQPHAASVRAAQTRRRRRWSRWGAPGTSPTCAIRCGSTCCSRDFVDRVAAVRARLPDRTGSVDRDGVAIHFEVFDRPRRADAAPRAAVADHPLADLEGAGPAPRPAVPGRHPRRPGQRPVRPARRRSSSTTAAPTSPTSSPSSTPPTTGTAVVVAHCHANWWVVDLVAAHPDAGRGVRGDLPGRAVPRHGRNRTGSRRRRRGTRSSTNPTGWELFNRHVISQRAPPLGRVLLRPATRRAALDQAVRGRRRLGAGVDRRDPRGERGRPGAGAARAGALRAAVPQPRCPDAGDPRRPGRVPARRQGPGLRRARRRRARRPARAPATCALVRDPVTVNRAITDFVERTIGGPMQSARLDPRARAAGGGVLYLSSPIGLGHARRDLAIAEELRRLVPDLEVDWLAQHPVTAVLEAAGETVHPASEWLASESAHVASESCGHDLHCFQALRRMDEILVANFMIFQEVVEEGLYDLVVGDEAWDVDHFWHENPELKRGQHVWLTDFVGFLPMPDGGDHEAFLTDRLQRRDDRAHRQLPADPRPVDLRRQPRRHRRRRVRTRAAEDPRLDRSALRLLRLHHRVLPADGGRGGRVAGRARLPRRRAGVRRHGRRLGRRAGSAGAGDRRPSDRPAKPCPSCA